MFEGKYLGSKRKPVIGSEVHLTNFKDADDWHGNLLELQSNAVLIEERGVRRLVPFTSFIDMVFVDDVREKEKQEEKSKKDK